MRSSDKTLRSRQFSSSELGENRVTSDMSRAHIHIYVFVRFCVHILMCSHINTFAYLHTNMLLCSYTYMQLCIYNHMKIWTYNFIFLYRYALWSLLFSLQVCHIHSENRVTYSISDPRGVSPDCKMCVRVTNTEKSCHYSYRFYVKKWQIVMCWYVAQMMMYGGGIAAKITWVNL